jgi:hypothetical protein
MNQYYIVKKNYYGKRTGKRDFTLHNFLFQPRDNLELKMISWLNYPPAGPRSDTLEMNSYQICSRFVYLGEVCLLHQGL